MSVFFQLRINSSLFQVVQNVLAYTVATDKLEIVVIVTILVDYIDSGPQRYEHRLGPLRDVKVSRHLNVYWGQQRALFGLIHLIRCQQHAIGRLVGVWVTKMKNTGEKSCFLKPRLYVLTKNGLLYCYKWALSSCFFWPPRNSPATQQMFKSYFG